MLCFLQLCWYSTFPLNNRWKTGARLTDSFKFYPFLQTFNPLTLPSEQLQEKIFHWNQIIIAETWNLKIYRYIFFNRAFFSRNWKKVYPFTKIALRIADSKWNYQIYLAKINIILFIYSPTIFFKFTKQKLVSDCNHYFELLFSLLRKIRCGNFGEHPSSMEYRKDLFLKKKKKKSLN